MEDTFVFDHTVGCDGNPSHGQSLIGYLVEQSSRSLDELTAEVGRIVQSYTTVSAFRNGAAVVVDVYWAVVGSVITVLSVIADI